MSDMPMYIGSVVGVLLIVLGFAALLSQRIYLDSRTQSPVEIDVPILGKMKANYPALVFVFLGVGITMYAIDKHQNANEVQWQVDGTFVADRHGINWQQGRLEVLPSKIDADIDPQTGRFKIRLAIPEGKTFEDAVERIDYSHHDGNAILLPRQEFEQLKNHRASMLTNATETTRTYKIRLEQMPAPLD